MKWQTFKKPLKIYESFKSQKILPFTFPKNIVSNFKKCPIKFYLKLFRGNNPFHLGTSLCLTCLEIRFAFVNVSQPFIKIHPPIFQF